MDIQTLKLKKYQPMVMKLDRPMVTISIVGFRFNKSSEKHMNRHYKFAELYYDKDQHIVAIKPTNELSENSFKICRSTRNNAFICAQDFMRRTGIRAQLKFKDYKSRRVFPSWSDKLKMFLLDLKPFIK